MPRLSVLMPVRNGGSTIHRAVASTLRAMPRDSELVVFDDASTDSTLEVLGRFEDRRLVVVCSPLATGIAGGLGRLLASTDSELVGRMDADDVTLPWRFSYQLPAISGLVQVTFTTVVDWHAPRTRVVPHVPVGIGPRAFPLHLVLTNPVSHPTMVATRAALERAGGYRDVPAEDYDLWIRFHLAGVEMRRLPAPSLAYRVHDTQVTASDVWRHSSWANPLVAKAYHDLSLGLLGRGYLRLNALATSQDTDTNDFDHILAEFSRDVVEACRSLGFLERRFVLKVLASRLTEVRALRTASVTGSAAR